MVGVFDREQELLKRRLNNNVCDGQRVLTIKQGGPSEVIIWLALASICIFQGTSNLYIGGRFLGLALAPVPDMAKFCGWIFLTVLCFLFAMWNALVYEVITAKDGQLLAEIRIGRTRCLSRKQYPVKDIKNLRLECLISKSGKSWRICFDDKNRIRRLDTQFYTLEDGYYFLDECLTPMLSGISA